jgi:hypothetical protein
MRIMCLHSAPSSRAFSRRRLVSFSYVGDDGALNEDRGPVDAAQCDYGSGLFQFTMPG